MAAQERVARVTEIIAGSPKSFDDAVRMGFARANKTLRGITGMRVMEFRVAVDVRNGLALFCSFSTSSLALESMATLGRNMHPNCRGEIFEMDVQHNLNILLRPCLTGL